MYTLYYSPGACSLAVHIVLEWLGEPYHAVKVDAHDSAYRTINPAGAVPAFDFGGEAPLTQCAAILHFLARTHPKANLTTSGSPVEAAQIDRWSAFLTGDLHPAFFPIFMPGRYTVSTEASSLEDVREAGRRLVKTKLTLLDDQLAGKAWIVDDQRTLVDAYATPMIRWAASMLPDGVAGFPSIAAHHKKMLKDPAVERVLKAEGLT